MNSDQLFVYGTLMRDFDHPMARMLSRNADFIGAAHCLDIPARYVGGYVGRADGVAEANMAHAWAEAYVADLGWVAFDPANGYCPTDAHVRIAIGLDAIGAAPVRGSRLGGGTETLAVAIRVDQ